MFPVTVGKTDLPLKTPLLTGPLPPFPSTAASSFHLLDGPPYANGAPHLGHVLNKHLKDALARAQNASGAAVRWQPGWDCHGLPLEVAVEKQGADRRDKLAFSAAARTFAESQVQLQRGVFEQQGWMMDWDNPWRTMDPKMEAGTLRVLADLTERGALEVRLAPLPWCPQCGSTLSGAEQEEKPVLRPSWVVPFSLLQRSACGRRQVLLSWTTTPWTLPLHRALVVNPAAEYVALEKAGELAWVASAEAADFCQRLGASLTTQLARGHDLVGLAYETPFGQGQVLGDECVVASAGTGVLHAVPGLSELDTEVGQAHSLPLVQHLSVHGKVEGSALAQQNGLRAGPEADAVVRPFYEASPWFVAQQDPASAFHCWRHGCALLTRPSRQVFLRLDDAVRSRALAMVEQLQFTPASGRERLRAAMHSRPHWCLSRQRTWGVPLALFLDKSSGQPHPKAAQFMRSVAAAVEQEGVSAWWARPSDCWLEGVSEEAVERVDDVLDVWFDSGCVPQLVGPADAVVEGTDQHRGWFQSCLWVAAALDKGLPFKRVVTHGFVVDATGAKLSKSKGGDKPAANALAPWHQLPTDLVRVWALMGTDGHDKSWSKETVDTAQALLSRWRGVVRFLLANAQPLVLRPGQPPLEALQSQVEASPAWDRYWLGQTQQACSRALAHLAQAEFGQAVSVMAELGEAFSSLALASWKDRLYCASPHSAERRALNAVALACLHSWGKALEALTPRLRAECASYWPAELRLFLDRTATLLPVSVSPQENSEVQAVLAFKNQAGPWLEQMQKQRKGGMMTLRVFWPQAPHWPGQGVADALGVSEVSNQSLDLVTSSSQLEVTLPEQAKLHLLHGYVCLSPYPLCPRCRRCAPSGRDPGQCHHCDRREACAD